MLHTLLSLTVALNTIISAEDTWTYFDQCAWADLADSQCGFTSALKQQSPIQIQTQNVDTHTCPSNDLLQWTLKSAPVFEVQNSGTHHNIKISLKDSAIGDGYVGGFLKNDFVTVSNEHTVYCLDSFHLHWDSEHTIDNGRSALEAHFVHYSCDYPSLTAAMAASPSDPYVLAVVAVMFDIGEENKFLKQITDNIMKIRTAEQTISFGNEDASVFDLFNVETEHPMHFYYYKGSLTTPPCSPIVQWHIFKTRMQLSQAQRDVLAQNIYDSSGTGTIVVKNYRDAFEAEAQVQLCPGDNVAHDPHFDFIRHITHSGSDDESEED